MCVTDPDVHAVPGHLDDHRADRHARRRRRARHPDHGAPGRALRRRSAATPRSSTATCGCRTRTSSATKATASCWPRSGWAPAGSTTRCAGSGSRSARSTCCASGRSRATRTGRTSRRSRPSRTGSPTRCAEMTQARLLTLYAAWKMDKVGAANARVEIAMIKFAGAQVLYNVIDRSLQVYGSLGFSDRHAARAHVPRRARRADLRRPRRGPPRHRRPPGPQGLQARRRAHRARPHPRAAPRRRSSPSTST